MMKKCGIIGGIGPEATVDYYRGIVEGYRGRIQDGSYPEIVIHSINMTKMIEYLQKNDRASLIGYLLSALDILKKAGADFAAMASNTPHTVFDELEKESPLPLVSIVRETMKAAAQAQFRRCGLLGTAFTMGNDFYPRVFASENISVAVPGAESRKLVHEIIFGELVFGKVTPESRSELMGIINRMREDYNIDSLILGCTELPLILKERESVAAGIPFLDTTSIHVNGIVDTIIL